MDIGVEASDTESKLIDVILKMNGTMERLQQTVERLSDAIRKPEDSDEIEVRRKIANVDESWETVRDTLQDQNKEITDNWKDELNNLLVFAGLFSAVVTAFTVESYTWLQQDPGDASNMFLARISLQLSAFTTGSGFVNSSAPALPLQNVTSSFTPPGVAIPVNTLWVLSLTLSLTSAFFAIAVQQWLRQLRLPGDVPLRQAVQLLSLRSDALQRWQVPSIISLLPLLLQIAVVLFLAGLFLLLRSLNATVTIAFGVVAATGLSAFLITAFIPLITIRCPYKSPLVPTVLIVLQWLSYPFAAVSIVMYGLFYIPLYHLERSIGKSHCMENIDDTLTNVMALKRLYDYVVSFSSHLFVDIAQFWLFREYRHILNLDDEHTSDLEDSSLVHVLLSIGSQSFARVMRCMYDFKSRQCSDILAYTVTKGLSAVAPVRIGSHGTIDFNRHRLKPEMEPYVCKWLSTRHHYLFRKALQRRNWTEDGQVSDRDANALRLFYKLDKAVSAGASQEFVQYLLYVCENQTILEHVSFWETVPACLVFDAISGGFIPGEQDTHRLLTFAYNCISETRRSRHFTLCLSSSTSALTALSLHPTIAATASLQAVYNLTNFLANDWGRNTLNTLLQRHYRFPNKAARYMSTLPMIQALSKALVKLAENHNILHSPQCPSICLSELLREVCAHSGGQHIVKARAHLDTFSSMIPHGGSLDLWEHELQERESLRELREREWQQEQGQFDEELVAHLEYLPVVEQHAWDLELASNAATSAAVSSQFMDSNYRKLSSKVTYDQSNQQGSSIALSGNNSDVAGTDILIGNATVARSDDKCGDPLGVAAIVMPIFRKPALPHLAKSKQMDLDSDVAPADEPVDNIGDSSAP